MMDRPEVDDASVFRATPSASLILDLGLRVRGANDAYLTATNRELDDLVGRHIFDAFPANPHYPEGDGVANLRESLHRVLASGEPHTMSVQRYDVPWAGSAGGFREKYWYPMNTPITGPTGEFIGILHVVEDITGFQDDLLATLDFYHREIVAHGDAPGAEESSNLRFSDYASVAMRNARSYPDVVTEVEHLRGALTSRAVIDQAKGIVMAHGRCSSEEAFARLVHESQKRHLKLRDVADGLVRRVTNQPQEAGVRR